MESIARTYRPIPRLGLDIQLRLMHPYHHNWRKKVVAQTIVATMCAKQSAVLRVLALLTIFLVSSTVQLKAVDPHRLIS